MMAMMMLTRWVGELVGSQSLTLPSDEIKTDAAEPHAMPGPFFGPALNTACYKVCMYHAYAHRCRPVG